MCLSGRVNPPYLTPSLTPFRNSPLLLNFLPSFLLSPRELAPVSFLLRELCLFFSSVIPSLLFSFSIFPLPPSLQERNSGKIVDHPQSMQKEEPFPVSSFARPLTFHRITLQEEKFCFGRPSAEKIEMHPFLREANTPGDEKPFPVPS